MDRSASNPARHAFARRFADFTRSLQGQTPFLGFLANRLGERMFRVLLNAGDETKHLVGLKARQRQDLYQRWSPNRQGSGLVKDSDRASIDGFEDDRILDDDAT